MVFGIPFSRDEVKLAWALERLLRFSHTRETRRDTIETLLSNQNGWRVTFTSSDHDRLRYRMPGSELEREMERDGTDWTNSARRLYLQWQGILASHFRQYVTPFSPL